MPGSFFDSNVALYAATGDPIKAPYARALVKQGGVVSVQVLNEVATVALREFKMTMPEVIDILNRLRSATVVFPVSVGVHENALWIHDRYRFAFYDCCIVAAALLADCDTLWSEDMHDGFVVDGRLTIRNPFA